MFLVARRLTVSPVYSRFQNCDLKYFTPELIFKKGLKSDILQSFESDLIRKREIRNLY